MNFSQPLFPGRIPARGANLCWKLSFAGAMLLSSLRPAPAAPLEPRKPVTLAKVDPKAVAFLDEVATSYRKLHALSVHWHRDSPTSFKPTRSQGIFVWRNSRPPQVRYEDRTNKDLVISDGRHTYRREHGTPPWVQTLAPDGYSGAASIVATDAITPFFLAGRNPLRAPSANEPVTTGSGLGTFIATGARLLGPLVIKGVRCRGLQFLHTVEMRDNWYAEVFTLWFDKQNLLRRFQKAEIYEDFQVKSLVDFNVTVNPKLSPALFRYPKAAVSNR